MSTELRRRFTHPLDLPARTPMRTDRPPANHCTICWHLYDQMTELERRGDRLVCAWCESRQLEREVNQGGALRDRTVGGRVAQVTAWLADHSAGNVTHAQLRAGHEWTMCINTHQCALLRVTHEGLRREDLAGVVAELLARKRLPRMLVVTSAGQGTGSGWTPFFKQRSREETGE